MAFEGQRICFRAGWAARREDPAALRAAAEGFLRVVADLVPALSAWVPRGREGSAEMSPGEIISATPIHHPGDQSPTFHLSASAVGPVAAGVSVYPAPEGQGERRGGVSLWLEPGVGLGSDHIHEIAAPLFSEMIEAWPADWVTVFPQDMGRLQLPDSSMFVVGVLTYVRAALPEVRVPEGGSVSTHARGSIFDLRGIDESEVVRSAAVLRSALERSGAGSVIGVRDRDLLTEHEAYLAMVDYLTSYAARAGSDLRDLLGDMDPAADGGSTDPAVWQDWIESVDRARAGHAPGPAIDNLFMESR